MADLYDISPERLAQIDQWHAARASDADGLVADLHDDVASEHPVGQAVEAYLLAVLIRASPVDREGLADLVAVLLARINHRAIPPEGN